MPYDPKGKHIWRIRAGREAPVPRVIGTPFVIGALH